MTKIEYPSGIVGDEEFGYNDIGHLVWKMDGNDKYTYYKYDTHNRLTDVYYDQEEPDPLEYPEGDGDVHYYYEGHTSLKTEMTDDSGTSEYTYDFQGRLDHYTPPAGLSSGYYIDYDYNNAGQKTSVKITNGTTTPHSVFYNYFANGWLKDVRLGSSNGTLVAEYEYDSVGNRTQALYGNSTYQEFHYEGSDPRWRLDNIHYFYDCGSGIADQGGLKFTRDDAGNPTRWGNLDGKYTRVYSYDENSRLKTANLPGSSHVVHSYDWVGNRQDTGFSYNAADQLTSRPEHTYQYDDAGNMTYDNSVHYTYTFSGLLSTAGDSSMVWDGAGNRISFTSSTDQSHPYTFVYDVTAGIPAVIVELHDGASVYYVREPNGALLARISGETTQYYHFDDLGSTLYLTGTGGTVTDTYAYDAWGNVTNHTGSTSQPYQYVGQLGYYSHYQDGNLPLVLLGVRYYSSELGRFTQRDLVGQGLNHYLYAGDQPVRRIDPTGRSWSLYDWFWHYYFGGGRAVSLSDDALLSNIFWQSDPVRSFTRQYESGLAKTAREVASLACRSGSRRSYIVGFNGPTQSAGPNVTWSPGLYAIGHTSITMSASCSLRVDCCTHRYRYVCNLDYSMRDRFDDVVDPFNLIRWHNIDLPASTPFDIYDDRQFYSQGTGRF